MPRASTATKEPPASILKPPSRHFKTEHQDAYFAWLQSIPSDEWAHLTVYVYRLWPVIVREQADPNAKKYIDKFGEPVTPEGLLHRWGSGKYQLRLTDSDVPRGSEICSAIVALDTGNWEKHPPTVPWNELDHAHRENAAYITWLEAKGMAGTQQQAQGGGNNNAEMIGLLRDLVTQLTTRQGPQANPETGAVVNRITEMLSDAHSASLKMATQGHNPLDLLAIIGKVKELSGNSSGANDAILTMLLKHVLDKSAAPAAPPPESNLIQMFELMDRLEERFGNKRGAATESIVEKIGMAAIDKLPEVVRNVTDLITAMKSGGPAPIRRNAATVNATAAALDPAAPQEQSMDPNAEAAQAIAQYGGFITAAIDRGQTGSAFAESVHGMFGGRVYARIRTLGKDGILSALKSSTIWEQLAQIEPEVDEFVADFIAYGDPSPDSEGDEE